MMNDLHSHHLERLDRPAAGSTGISQSGETRAEATTGVTYASGLIGLSSSTYAAKPVGFWIARVELTLRASRSEMIKES